MDNRPDARGPLSPRLPHPPPPGRAAGQSLVGISGDGISPPRSGRTWRGWRSAAVGGALATGRAGEGSGGDGRSCFPRWSRGGPSGRRLWWPWSICFRSDRRRLGRRRDLGAAASIGGARCGLPGGRHPRVQMGGLPRLRGWRGRGGATAAPRWPPGVPWEASSPTRSTPVRAGYVSDYGRCQYCLNGSGGWAWIRGKLQAGVAATPKSTPSAPIPFLEASVWIIHPSPLP